MCRCTQNNSLPSVPGCVDQLGAECITYQTGKSVKTALDEIQLASLLPRLITFLQANPTFKTQLAAALNG